MKRLPVHIMLWLTIACACCAAADVPVSSRPNVLLIYADDIGYGDFACYGATEVRTPNVDRLAREGLRFTDGHSPSATCTPSRYAMLTGEYAWRKKGTGILAGDAAMIIQPGRTTLASILQDAGYDTAVIGKWHLGLGNGNLDWNQSIKPGPLEIGFRHAFLIPATGDRVPCVYVEDHHVVGLEAHDPIRVSFREPIGDEPTGRTRQDLLKMQPSHGHNQTIVNGISRIGYMSGGQAARWIDEEMADVITERAVAFLRQQRSDQPFFLFFSTHDIHVPRVPHERFVGQTSMGPRGDCLAQFDWCVGQLLQTLDACQLAENTLVILTSDNGPVVDDGYQDDAVERLGSHQPAGPFRGGKYSAFEAGTRVPMIVRWPKVVEPGVSDALISQVDFSASLAALVEYPLQAADALDSMDLLPALLGQSDQGRDHLVEHAGSLALREGKWKYIEPSNGSRFNNNTNTELGNNSQPALYDLADDPSESTNLAKQHPELVRSMAERLERTRAAGRSRP